MKPTASEHDPRFGDVLDVIFKYAAGDLKARGKLSDRNSPVDGVMAGVNILGEELEAYAAETERAHDSLKRALDYAQTLIRSSPDGILAVDRDLRITEWNLIMEQICGLTRAEAIGRRLDEVPFMRETGEAARIKACLAGKPAEPREIDYAALGADRPSVFESLAAPLQGPRGQALGAVVRVRDVTEHRRAEEKLRRASLYARSLIEAALDPMVTIDAEGRITDANEAAVSGTGVPRESLIGSRIADYFTDPAEARAAHEEAFAKGIVRNVPLTLRHASGKATDVLYNASVYRDDRGGTAGVLAVARDITERKRAEQAEALARRDSLTGLCNHRTFYDLLEGETVRARRFKRPVSVLMLDIDYFKRVNDTDGHQAGDMILRKLGDLLLRRARAVDHVCRYGGEEFALILPETDTQAGAEIAERLRDDIERERFIVNGGKPVAITVSIGVATYPQQAVTAEELIRAADVALYEAKHGGRNRVVRCAAERPS